METYCYVLSLDGKTPILYSVGNPLDSGWLIWLEANAERRLVKQDVRDGLTVSTTFIGYSIDGSGLWETLVLGGDPDMTYDLYEHLWPTYETAVDGHNATVAAVFSSTPFSNAPRRAIALDGHIDAE